ncbi:unnamed protein product [Larinioides sclopetarius]|uniref:Uncharacterized protein n=1 Tax=Larinioides sclopetarius TaxID=280406 RepID=A0AAV2B5P6_9ARAC
MKGLILLILIISLIAAEDNWKSAGLDDDRNYAESRYLRDPRDFARAFSDDGIFFPRKLIHTNTTTVLPL